MAGVRRTSAGFTLIELLVVVAIIGIIAALLIPNLINALQRAKQVRTVSDMRNTGSAMMSWLTDQVGAAAAGAATTEVAMSIYPLASFASVKDALIPLYTPDVPPVDGWKRAYEYRFDVARPEVHVMAIRSRGSDGSFDRDVYPTGAFSPTDYQQDIVWTDGFFVRWPQKVTN